MRSCQAVQKMKRRRLVALLCLIVLEIFIIWLTTEYAFGDEAKAVYISKSSRMDQRVDRTACIIGVDVAATVLFGSAVYFGSMFFREKELRQERELQNEALSEKDKRSEIEKNTRSRFLSTMSHEIRTPVNAIMGTVKLAIKNIHDENNVERSLKMIDVASRHILLLVNDVLDMSSIENGKAYVSRRPFKLQSVLDESSSVTAGQLQDRNLDFIRDFGKFTYSDLIGDGLHLTQILINILANAVKYTPDGGTITFRAYESDTEENSVSCRFEIEDDGIGMSAEFMKHMWEPYAREMQENSERQGTGLGLAIVKKYTELMNGKIEVESCLRKGSRFILTFPFDINKSVEDNIQMLTGMKILIADDSVSNRKLAKTFLELKGADVDTAQNGQDAVNMFIQSHEFYYDAVLLDMMMPVMNGFSAAEKIRNSERKDSAAVTLIALTGCSSDADISAAKRAGVDDFVPKPVDYNLLTKSICMSVSLRGRPKPDGSKSLHS